MAEKKQFLLRIPMDLWEEMSRWAGDELRSMNAQIEYVLREAVRRRRRRERDGEGGGDGGSKSRSRR